MARPGKRYEIRRLPMERLPQVEMLRVMGRRSAMHGLFEADVTTARRLIREHEERTGERRSFTAFLVACLARAVEENPEVQAFRKGRRRLIVFEEVDVATLIEVDAGGRRVPFFHVIRDAGKKSVGEIHREIRAAQSARADLDLRRRQIGRMRLVPRPLRLLLWRGLARAPHLWKKMGGTVVVTSIGMFGKGSGWGLSVPTYPISLTAGGIGERLALRDGAVETREHLSLTLSFDHEIIDGAPATRLGSRLKELIEDGYGLPNAAPPSEVPDEGERSAPTGPVSP